MVGCCFATCIGTAHGSNAVLFDLEKAKYELYKSSGQLRDRLTLRNRREVWSNAARTAERLPVWSGEE